MKSSTYKKLLLLAGMCYFLQGCKDEINLPSQDESIYDQIYMPQAVNGPVSKTLVMKEEEQSLIYGANVGGRGYPKSDIKVSFYLDADKLAAYNTANQTTLELPPAGSVVLSANDATIRKGALATEPLKLRIKTNGNNALKLFKNYLVPISISSDYKINANLQTTYYLLRSEPDISQYPDYDRSGWTVIGFSSQESSGEGPNNGRAIFAFDNNVNTFWHSQWTGNGAVLPHYITVDMGSVKMVHGCNFIQRQASGADGKANLMEIHYSKDNITWQKAADIQLQALQSLQKIWLPEFVEARYLKFVIVTNHSKEFSNMAEIGAF
ncbi:discoidin domain-containing protein [Pedobacter sp. GR22-6]|uniref:discoidin domain-containing protein n=1 Tax=Pedobacter sp. GR22-6 TaxID=3127957 RepID=UPI00307E5D24